MTYSRRQFNKLALSTLPVAAAAISNPTKLFAANKPDSKFGGVQIGVITAYSYHDAPATDAASLLKYLIRDGISGTEMENTQEQYAGAPKMTSMQVPGKPYVRVDPPAVRPPAPPEQIAAQKAFAEKLTAWRLSAPMDKFVELRKMYNDAGVNIYAFKVTLAMDMPDAEFDYAFKAAKACGADQMTMELPADPALTERVGHFASKHKLRVGYHYHLLSTPTAWDQALSQSPYNGINVDIGHYTAAGNPDIVAFVRKHHDRITSVHLKDRKTKANGGANTPWGQGETPIKEVLLLMKKEGYKFEGTIEQEYTPPAGSDCEKEIVKCLEFCKKVLTA